MLLESGETLDTPGIDATVKQRAQDILDAVTVEAQSYLQQRYRLTYPAWDGGRNLVVANHTAWLAVWQIVSVRYNPTQGDLKGSVWETNEKRARQFFADVRDGKVDLIDSLQPVSYERAHNTGAGRTRQF